ncbi:hypothetical protein SAMN04487948_101502 [Halogranum amylolyticum]|uniref:Uncharacterized protein n=1 Tax=Halogranum amylolyticum TaxID=660520 RepID=A0A1H8NFE8_9EURY|nr:hypothetical protein [Halogranum amylolyticum]SEO28123.1 hypothetical protein SAMN04487948_101502 [Halogranum amylolyticum]
MSQPETHTNQSELATDVETESTFLDRIEFLTGEDPDLGSFLLVVGIVTCVFIALFQFTLPTPVAYLLTAGVLFVTVLSAIIASLLDGFGYFGQDTTTTTTESVDRETAPKPWVPTERVSAPLPPVINFDAELRAYADMYGGELPAEFDPFIRDYLRLKTNTTNRATIASDLRAGLNPIGARFEAGSEGDKLYEDISQRLFRYISNRGGHVAVDRIAFYEEDGTETDVKGLRGRVGRVELTVTNEGEPAEVELTVELYDRNGSTVSSRSCTAGAVGSGATKVLDTDIFVPSDAERAGTAIRISDPGRTATSV